MAERFKRTIRAVVGVPRKVACTIVVRNSEGPAVVASEPEAAVVWADPLSIRRCLSPTIVKAYKRAHGFDFKYCRDGSRVTGLKLNGYWDRFLADATTIPEWRGFHERFVEGRPWHETTYYRRLKAYESETALLVWRTKMERWDRLFEDMRTRGYRSQSQVLPEIRHKGWATEGTSQNEIQVVLTRSGELVRVQGGGRHRFIMARILRIPRIPVVVNVWHAKAEARFAELRGEPSNSAGRVSCSVALTPN